jgi:hypothetical protein
MTVATIQTGPVSQRRARGSQTSFLRNPWPLAVSVAFACNDRSTKDPIKSIFRKVEIWAAPVVSSHSRPSQSRRELGRRRKAKTRLVYLAEGKCLITLYRCRINHYAAPSAAVKVFIATPPWLPSIHIQYRTKYNLRAAYRTASSVHKVEAKIEVRCISSFGFRHQNVSSLGMKQGSTALCVAMSKART